MRHTVQFQYRPRGNDRPFDYGQPFNLDVGATVTLPNIGDHVRVDGETSGERAELDGVVESRLFSYVNIGSDYVCLINIVLTDTDTDWGKLLKE